MTALLAVDEHFSDRLESLLDPPHLDVGQVQLILQAISRLSRRE